MCGLSNSTNKNDRATRMIKPPYELHTCIYPILGFWGSKVPKNGRFSAPGCRWTILQNTTLLALSRAKKSVTKQTNTHKKHTNHKRYIHTLLIGMCG